MPKAKPERLAQPESSSLERLLNTAADLFWRTGFAATTTRQIASALGIQQASLYYHIKSKEELLARIFTSSLERLQAGLEPVIAAVDEPAEQMRALIVTHLGLLLKYQKWNAVMVTELRALTGPHRTQVLAQRKHYADLVRASIEHAQKAGVVRGDVPARLLNLVLLNLLNRACVWYQPEEDVAPGELGRMFADLFLAGAATPALRGRLGETPLELDASSKRNPAPAPVGKKEDTSLHVLRAAAALFAKKGYYLTNTREIAERVGIQKASLYYHIAAKEDLLFEICRGSIERLERAVLAETKGATEPLDQLERLIRAHVECVLRDQNMHATALADFAALSAARRAEVEAARAAYEARLWAVLRRGQTAGILRKDIHLKYLSLGLRGLMDRVQMWYQPNGELSPRQIAALISTVFLKGAGQA